MPAKGIDLSVRIAGKIVMLTLETNIGMIVANMVNDEAR